MLDSEKMYAISQEISRQYAPLLPARPMHSHKKIALSSQELLSISLDIARQFKPKLSSTTSKLLLLPIDLGHLYASWNLGQKKITQGLDNAEKQQLVLRIYPQQQGVADVIDKRIWFDSKINPQHTRHHVTIPVEYRAKKYTAALGTVDYSGGMSIHAQSEVVNIPIADHEAHYPAIDNTLTLSSPHHHFSVNQKNSAGDQLHVTE